MASRTKNVTINSIVSIVTRIIMFIFQFACRTVFIKALSTEYLGVNGLFTNILTILSFAELGIGNAILFKLYKAVANDEKEEIKKYLHFYKKTYIIIGIIVLIVGVLIAPFLQYIIKDAPSIKESIVLIYLLFILNSAVSYFFTYKRSIIYVYQKDYISRLIEFFVTLGLNIAQILVLIFTKNYILYLSLHIVATLLINIIISIKADKLYPFIKDKEYTKISKEEEKGIFSDVRALILYKFGGILSNGTDNIIISTFVGISKVGLLSNYTTITSAITTLTTVLFESFQPSIGNLNAIAEDSKREKIYYEILLISFYVFSIAFIGIAILSSPFITIWIGSEYILETTVAIAIALNIYIEGVRFANYTFRNTLGLYKQGKFVPLVSSLTNVGLSLILVKPLGIFGVLIATSISTMFIMSSVDPYLLHKYKFNSSPKRYYITYFYYLVILCINYLVCNYVCNLIPIVGLLGFVIKAIVIVLITIIIDLVFTSKLKEFKDFWSRIKGYLNRLKAKFSKKK